MTRKSVSHWIKWKNTITSWHKIRRCNTCTWTLYGWLVFPLNNEPAGLVLLVDYVLDALFSQNLTDILRTWSQRHLSAAWQPRFAQVWHGGGQSTTGDHDRCIQTDTDALTQSHTQPRLFPASYFTHTRCLSELLVSPWLIAQYQLRLL